MCNLVGVELFFDYSGGSLLQHKSGGGDIDHHVLSSSWHLSASYILALYSDPLLHFQNGFRNPLAETTQILGWILGRGLSLEVSPVNFSLIFLYFTFIHTLELTFELLAMLFRASLVVIALVSFKGRNGTLHSKFSFIFIKWYCTTSNDPILAYTVLFRHLRDCTKSPVYHCRGEFALSESTVRKFGKIFIFRYTTFHFTATGLNAIMGIQMVGPIG